MERKGVEGLMGYLSASESLRLCPAGRVFGLLGVALVALACFAGTARADDLCVGVTLTCASAFNYPADAAGLQQAFDDSAAVSHPASDSIYVAGGVYESASGFSLDIPLGQSASIVGSGSAQTVLRAVGAANTSLVVSGDTSTAYMTSLSVESNAALGGATAIYADVSIHAVSSSVHCRAVNCTALEIDDADVWFDTGTITADSGGSVAFDVSGSSSSPNYVKVTKISGFETGVMSVDRTVVLRSVLIDLGGISGAIGASLDLASASSDRRIDLVGSSVIGEGANQMGVVAENASALRDSQIFARSTAIDLAGAGAIPFDCDALSTGETFLTTIYSAYDTAADGDCTLTTTAPLDIKTSPAKYVNRDARDLRLSFGSPFIDTGEPAIGESAVYDSDDVNDKTRPRGTRYDIGATEYQNLKPVITGEIQFSRAGQLGNLVTAWLNVTDPDADPLEYTWIVDGVALPGTPTVTTELTGAVFGSSATFRVTVKDPTGKTDAESTSIKVNPGPPFKLTNVTNSMRLLPAPKKTKFTVVSRRPKGRSFAFSVNADAQLTIKFQRIFSGRYDKKHRCDTSGKARRGTKCVFHRRMKKPTVSTGVKAGGHWLRLGGRVGKTNLKSGSYYVTVVGTSGTHSSNASFRMKVR